MLVNNSQEFSSIHAINKKAGVRREKSDEKERNE